MFFAALLGVTLVPVLMLLLIRGQHHAGTQKSRQPLPDLGLSAGGEFRPALPLADPFAGAGPVMAATIVPLRRLGSEFMPPLNEGTILFMPTAVPGMSISEATRILQIQDRLLRTIPEVAIRLRQGRPGRNAHRSRAALHVRDRRHPQAARPMARRA